VKKLVLSVVVLTMVAATSAYAQRRGGGGGAPARGRSGPSQGHAVPRAAAPVHGPYGGGAGTRSGYYRPYNYRSYYRYPYYRGYRGYPYYRAYYPYYWSYPYYYPGFSIGFTFGFPLGYSSFNYGYPYPYGYSYPYSYPYTYRYPYPYASSYPTTGYAYPTASSAYPPLDTTYPGTSSSHPRSDVTARASGGVTFDITPSTAEVYADGNFVGVVADFAPSAQPLILRPGRHHIEVQAPGYQTMVLDTDVLPGQAVPYRGSMRPLRQQ
jgi:hypothetical protein